MSNGRHQNRRPVQTRAGRARADRRASGAAGFESDLSGLRRGQKNTFALTGYRDLPNGGLAAIDLCALIDIDLFVRPHKAGDVVRRKGLLMRSALDLRTAYPNTSRTIRARDILITLPAGRYAKLPMSSQTFKAWYSKAGGSYPELKQGVPTFMLDGSFYSPVK